MQRTVDAGIDAGGAVAQKERPVAQLGRDGVDVLPGEGGLLGLRVTAEPHFAVALVHAAQHAAKDQGAYQGGNVLEVAVAHGVGVHVPAHVAGDEVEMVLDQSAVGGRARPLLRRQPAVEIDAVLALQMRLDVGGVGDRPLPVDEDGQLAARCLARVGHVLDAVGQAAHRKQRLGLDREGAGRAQAEDGRKGLQDEHGRGPDRFVACIAGSFHRHPAPFAD